MSPWPEIFAAILIAWWLFMVVGVVAALIKAFFFTDQWRPLDGYWMKGRATMSQDWDSHEET